MKIHFLYLEVGKPTIIWICAATEPTLRDDTVLRQKALVPMSKVEMVLPMEIGDYTDFFSSMHHAKNCGTIFVGPETPIPPNGFHLPIAYHGRASYIVISGTDIIDQGQKFKLLIPCILTLNLAVYSASLTGLILYSSRGQGRPAGNSSSYFGPSLKLDFELEMAAVVGPGNELGKAMDVNEAADHIFGVVLMNDWSARDIQAWEYVPLGPFLGKSFDPVFNIYSDKDASPLPYLAEKISKNYDIALEVQIKPSGQKDSSVVTISNLKNLYWTLTQQLAHHTINGCNLRPGDLLGTGTISGPEPDSLGCLLELTWNGQKPLSLNGTALKFLEDGDEVIFTGYCKGSGDNVGFGTCAGKVVPPRD
ncbi:transcription initiation factor IIF subunit alpha-like isoform X1 [Hibiscus syriacus]|uniref:Fumarylacetoacetase n=1 Tax=Hibiscus syriacus TaxID=106335 RepID=A0A6A3B197_HIBSY|nr:transcription initiation factor IIF subunit alpha-like isoform X1 [Hibiscus syriacus]